MQFLVVSISRTSTQATTRLKCTGMHRINQTVSSRSTSSISQHQVAPHTQIQPETHSASSLLYRHTRTTPSQWLPRLNLESDKFPDVHCLLRWRRRKLEVRTIIIALRPVSFIRLTLNIIQIISLCWNTTE